VRVVGVATGRVLRFDDVRVYRDDAAGGVRVRYVLYPSHPVDKIEFRGMVELPDDDLRKAVRDRFGIAAPPERRKDDVARLLKDTYRARGYPQATVTPQLEETHNPERATLVFEIQAGPRVGIAQVRVNQEDQTAPNVVVGAPDVRAGQPYDAARIDKELDRYVSSMRERGYLEARASHMAEFGPSGADVTLDVFRGPHVTIAFTGDPIPSGERDRLVPINRKYGLKELLDACRRFPVKRRDRITFEYVMLKDVNDTDEDARRLVRLLNGIRAKVNLLPLNEAAGIPYERPADARVNRFAQILAERGVTVSVRKSRGRDIRAACGQLITESTRQKSPGQLLASLIAT